MDTISIGLGSNSYLIDISTGNLSSVGIRLKNVGFPTRLAIVSNDVVAGLYLGPVKEALVAAGFKVEIILVPDGEEYKNHSTLIKIYDALIRAGFDRHTGLIALGGGVVGDMVGFAAATFLRGIPFVQIPTTLLAQVDSSVGGKTGINHPLGKNLIGAFYQPRNVLIDVSTLGTLPAREFSAGMAEVVKYGIIRDREFFEWLENEREMLNIRDSSALIRAVKTSCQIKANVVEIDEREDSLRAILNFGHTFGHAVENLAGYGVYRHGEAVAIGMVVAASLSCELGFCSKDDVDRIKRLIVGFGLPVVPPSISIEDYLAAMGRDKKSKDGTVRFVLNCGLGDCSVQVVEDLPRLLNVVLARLQRVEA
jgi:3-dehydroquinate synthase